MAISKSARAAAEAIRDLAGAVKSAVHRRSGSSPSATRSSASVDRALADGIRKGQHPELVEAMFQALEPRLKK